METPSLVRAPRRRPLPSILFVLRDMSLSGPNWQVMHLARALRAQGAEIIFTAPESGPMSVSLQEEEFGVRLDRFLLIDPNQLKLRELARQSRVVVANGMLTWRAVQAAKLEGVRSIWSLPEPPTLIRLVDEVEFVRASLPLADVIVTHTELTAEILGDLTRVPIVVAGSGVPMLAARPAQNGERVKFLFVARFDRSGSHESVLDAIERLPVEIARNASFVLAGEAAAPAFWRTTEARAAEFPHVALTKSSSFRAVEELVTEADVFLAVLPTEPAAFPFLQAASAGKAIIASATAALADRFEDGRNALFVLRSDAGALAGAISRLVTDRSLGGELGAAARRTAQRHFSLEEFVERFARLLRGSAPPDRDVASAPRDYQSWLAKYDAVTPRARFALRRELAHMRRPPCFSIVLPVFDPDLEVLDRTLASVRKQSYQHWELCIADDASTRPEIREFLTTLKREEPRARIVFRAQNGGIAACSNSALALAKHEWCALLDHDDVLAEDALALVARALSGNSDARIIYSDQDSIDLEERRSNPFFKTKWDPLLFLGQNFVNHLGVYRTELLREIGGFREGYEGSQDYDLILRCTEKLHPEQILHLPRVLYHWRSVPGSVGASANEKLYARDAARQALRAHLERSAINGRVEASPNDAQFHRVVFALREPAPLVSILITTRDKPELLERCLRSLRTCTDYQPIEIVIVDNGSVEPETRVLLQKFEDEGARIMRDDGPFNFSRLNNLAARSATGEFLLFLNNDVEAVDPAWLTELVSQVDRPEVGAAGARLRYPDGRIQHAGVILGLGGVAGHAEYGAPLKHGGYFGSANLHHHCSAVTAACLLIRAELFRDLGGFDAKNLPINFNDVDLCLRIRRRGLAVVWTPYADLVHDESASRGRNLTAQQVEQLVQEATFLQEKWGEELLNDPFYNPNLSLDLPGYELAFPPRTRAREFYAAAGFRAMSIESCHLLLSAS